ncbi:MAG: DUF421 domain-containing protein [Actinomycetales bacterium]|nr:DUF421 domain-containing protein [Actinomycetales bacterium]
MGEPRAVDHARLDAEGGLTPRPARRPVYLVLFVVVHAAEPLLDVLRGQRMALDDLISAARQQGIERIGDIRVAVLETNGQLCFFARSTGAPAHRWPRGRLAHLDAAGSADHHRAHQRPAADNAPDRHPARRRRAPRRVRRRQQQPDLLTVCRTRRSGGVVRAAAAVSQSAAVEEGGHQSLS